MRFIGWDQSLAHGACVTLGEDGALEDWQFVTDRAADDNPFTRGHCTVAPAAIRGAKKSKSRIDDLHVHGVARLRFLKAWFEAEIGATVRKHGSDGLYYGVEDYAHHAKGQTHLLGEAGGQLRLSIVYYGRLRLWNVEDVKMFATGKGGSGKDAEVRPAVMRDYSGSEFADIVTGLEARGVSNDVVGDLVDAFVLARLTRTEVFLRMGRMALSDVPGTVDTGPRRVFYRATDKMKLNVLDRPFATGENTRPEGE